MQAHCTKRLLTDTTMIRQEFIDDLVPLILDAHSNWWPRDLVTLSLVSPCWLYYSRKRLYPYPTIDSWSAARLLARTVTESPHLGSLVTGIRLQPMKDSGRRGGATAEEWEGLRQLLTLEGLKRVHIGGLLSIEAERFIPMIGDGESVEELEVDGSLLWEGLSKTPSLVWSDNVAFQFPNLQKLRLRCIELEIEESSIRYESPIQSLVVDEVSLTGGHLVDILSCSENVDSVEIWTRDSATFDEEVGLVVGSCRLRRLSYQVKQARYLGENILGGEWKDWDGLKVMELDGILLDLAGLQDLEKNGKNIEELTIKGRFIRIKTPPRTPDDNAAESDSFHFPVVVAAPVSGVETMDALVDGMNGGDSSSSRSFTRSRFNHIPNHHPLYQPPLPIPPPGVVLGGGKVRRQHRKPQITPDSSDDDDPLPTPTPRNGRKTTRPSSARSSNIKQQPQDSYFPSISDKESTRPRTSPSTPPISLEYRKSVVPSISEIIQSHPELQSKSRPPTSSLYSSSLHGHPTLREEVESEPEPLTNEEAAELLSRSSIDSVADEVQRTIRNQPAPRQRSPYPPSSASAFIKRQSTISDNASSIYSPRSDPGAASIYSVSAPSSYLPPSSPLEMPSFLSSMSKPPSPSQAVAQYLRSARLTTLLRLTRSPHAAPDNPLTVSLSDLGCSTGYPVVVFLGLGCVRHIMGLYDEMADCMGLRIITIDRWGLGRTEPRPKSSKGIIQWASVVEEVLDLLHIDQCSVMAHSAGAPYALSFANKLPHRIRGDVCLLAPWVGGSESSKNIPVSCTSNPADGLIGGYKWLKYVPNSILKTAQAAEWKIQAWMIGKPPTIAYEGIGYTAPPIAKSLSSESSPRPSQNLGADVKPRPSIGSSTFSDYDDLRDFDGRFESRSTLGIRSQTNPEGVYVTKRKTSRGILEILKGSPTVSPQHPQDKEKPPSSKRLKGLRSMGSLKSKSSRATLSRKSEPPSPQLPPPLHIDIGLGLENMAFTTSPRDMSTYNLPAVTPSPYVNGGVGPQPRASGRRSISFTSSKAATSIPSSPSPSAFATSFTHSVGGHPNHQAALGNALIAASHAESSKGTHSDLLQILNHENHSWGFSYAAYPHKVRVWYGDKDEKIAENAVRWMERTMGPDKCLVKVVKGADHGLMYRSSAVVDVLELILSSWREDRLNQPFASLR
ncbi:hypothetical protein CVT24_000860 [Panaeolus cyanescens]|uniref:AB hydrolase-1 domain-containing protein n=1 Tax=Panaeolus cyanescens TaxID=181874 RepID=A0A409VWX4_9AGAR|nr:hypothetical protein CVT24_000860 [Panaeolus cyanescens]